VGYVMAVLLEVIAIALGKLFLQMFPRTRMLSLLEILVVGLVALGWGTGPGLLATLVGALLVDYFLLPPYFALPLRNPADALGLILFLGVGVIISSVTSMLVQARRTAEALASSLATEQVLLREANRRMGEFLSIANHELRTPMTSMMGYLELAELFMKERSSFAEADVGKRDHLLDDMEKILTRTRRQVQIQHRLVNDLLEASAIEKNQLEMRMRDCELTQIVHEAIEDQRVMTPDRTIHLQIPPEKIWCTLMQTASGRSWATTSPMPSSTRAPINRSR
jgi:signal transduction histidine kinase